jgi:hypothetical protein
MVVVMLMVVVVTTLAFFTRVIHTKHPPVTRTKIIQQSVKKQHLWVRLFSGDSAPWVDFTQANSLTGQILI